MFLPLAVCIWLQQGALVVGGAQEAHIAVHLPAQPFELPQINNEGYVQRVISSEDRLLLQVIVRNRPLKASVGPKNPNRLPLELGGLIELLQERAPHNFHQQLALMVHWLNQEFEYDAVAYENQTVSAVLRDRAANCVGLANLSAYILSFWDVPVRHVTGLRFRTRDDALLKLDGDVMHRWLEIYLEDNGWVYFDPSGTVNFVTALYVTFGIHGLHPVAETLEQARGNFVELFRLYDGFKVLASDASLSSHILVRPSH